MKYTKLLGLLAVAAAALMAFASPASADTITGPTGAETPGIHAVSKGHVKLQTFVNIECPSTAEGAVTSHKAGEKVKGSFSTLTFGHPEASPPAPCTNNWVVTVENPGTLSVEWIKAGEGTVFSSEATVVAHRLGIKCNYVTNTTHIGTFLDHTKAENGLGELIINAEIPIHSGSSALCGTGKAKWSGTYLSTTKLTIHDS